MDHLRQLGILDPKLIQYPVTMIGCGGIGSPTALALAKAGFPKILLFDHDVVDNHNIPDQLFQMSDVGKYKVHALAYTLSQFSDCEITALAKKFDSKSCVSGIVISGVDSMLERCAIWEKLRYNIQIPLYIEGRVGGEILEVFTIQPSQIEDNEFYQKFLFTDKEAAVLPCTARNIIYTGFVISGLIVSQLAHWLRRDPYFRRVNFDLKTMTTVFQN